MFKIITDSTSTIPTLELEAMGITVVPLTVHFGEESYVDGVDLSPAEFYEKMAEYYPQGLPTTACPAPGAFARVFEDAIAEGADGILCITLGSGVSGTYNSAVAAAQNITDPSCPIEIIDSKTLLEPISLMIEKACRMRDEGAGVAKAADHMRAMTQKMEIFLALDTVENLVKGGRMDQESGAAAIALKIKPIVHMTHDLGVIETIGKARGGKALVSDTVQLVLDFIEANGACEIRFCRGGKLDRINEVKLMLDEAGVAYNDKEPGWIGPVIGTHTGKDAIGVCVCPRSLID